MGLFSNFKSIAPAVSRAIAPIARQPIAQPTQPAQSAPPAGFGAMAPAAGRAIGNAIRGMRFKDGGSISTTTKNKSCSNW